MTDTDTKPILVLGATGKTGRRVVERLTLAGVPVRAGSRASDPPFDWDDPTTWAPALDGAAAAYISYYPDLAAPGAVEATSAFARLAVEMGVRRLVLLAGRGEDEAERAEQAVRESGADLTIVRSTWFMQNFSEGDFRGQVLSGNVTLPAGDQVEPFVDADDIADVAVAALTEDGHVGELYELTGPRLLSFAEAIDEIANATGRDIQYAPVTVDQFASAMAAQNVPGEAIAIFSFLFSEILDGRNAHLTDGVQRALGREPRDFRDFVKDAAVAGVWTD
ncbi:MAG: NAD(P)H-binding protein [Actinomycetota bacterium]|nr:NAD(P)H-binding protein [Actinomycetota bacterium]